MEQGRCQWWRVPGRWWSARRSSSYGTGNLLFALIICPVRCLHFIGKYVSRPVLVGLLFRQGNFQWRSKTNMQPVVVYLNAPNGHFTGLLIWRRLHASWHEDAVKATCWNSKQICEWQKKNVLKGLWTRRKWLLVFLKMLMCWCAHSKKWCLYELTMYLSKSTSLICCLCQRPC